ncbi:GDYXXLXY domain-containing protein [Flavihumibacter sp. CACIAM 22H1]|uniref:GDYXXLXY domain-containing protein n=1 Tax=Flavihumibacter sp. CACIAM 22H1 TaxID=1812911 RepID=UPI0007A8F884|nr:GDYXXLXY domain-containing protein [Flavihumibacter sp. CACIAM 22H1]KYP16368.1 MAG: hypothetical protein A1D16_17055 [Flavihumibacter sp. CACIAM 22H1]
MKQYKTVIVLLNLALLAIYFVFSVYQKEKLLKNGTLLLFELAPVDPRSLMQGDYMQLRYAVVADLASDSIPKRGYCVVKADQNNIARLVRIQQQKSPLQEGEKLVAYSSPSTWNISIGAESFFFQEGEAGKYDSARYGGIKVDEHGNSLLIGLYDAKRARLN